MGAASAVRDSVLPVWWESTDEGDTVCLMDVGKTAERTASADVDTDVL